MTTQTLLTEWLETYEKEHIKSRTYSRYQGLITAHINPTLGKQNIEDLSRRDIQEFLSQQKAEGNIRSGGGKLSATSANLMLTVLTLLSNMLAIWSYSNKTRVSEYGVRVRTPKRLRLLRRTNNGKLKMQLWDPMIRVCSAFSSAYIPEFE